MARAAAREGHNSIDNAVREKLRSIVDRVESLNGEIAALQEDRKEVYAEAKGSGYDVKALRDLIRIRAKDQESFEEHIEMVNTYRRALGEPEIGL